MKRKAFVAIFLAVAASLFGETVFLKDGTVLKGSIKDQNETAIVIRTDMGEITIQKEKIDHIDLTESAKQQNEPAEQEAVIRNSSFMFRPLATVVAAASGYFDMYFEGQTAFSSKLALGAIGEVGTIEGIFVSALNIGPQINLSGKYLDGVYLGIFPGFVYLTDYNDSAILLTAMAEMGYQGITEGGFAWGVYIGYLLATESSFKFGVKIGWAYQDRLVKPKD